MNNSEARADVENNYTSEDTVRRQVIRVLDEELIDLNFASLVAGDQHPSLAEKKTIKRVKATRGSRYYSDLIFTVCHQYYPFEKAETIWNGILRHKQKLHQSLGRNVGITVATLDFLTNTYRVLPGAEIISGQKFKTMARMTVKDSLTNLFSRGTFDSRLRNEMRLYSRYGNAVSLIMVDVDDFKKINDEYGHQKGDAILACIGRLIKKGVRDVDTASRYGGEEFVVILPQMGLKKAVDIAKRLRVTVESTFRNDGSVTISLGVANCPDHAKDEKTLLEAADRALHSAKLKGKNQVAVPVGVNLVG